MSRITSISILALGIIGVLLILSKDTIIPTQIRTYSLVQTVYNNNTVVGALCIAASYYLYSSLQGTTTMDSTSELTSATPDIPLPSQDVATSDLL